MGALTRAFTTLASADDAWAAARDIGALHTRLVPGFVVDTRLEPGARVVTFASGQIVREPIVAIDDAARRLVWTAEGGRVRHYNAALQVFAPPDGPTRVQWTIDYLPDEIEGMLAAAMDAGTAAMRRALDALAR